MKKIIAISGSTRQQSINLDLIHAISELYSGKLEFNVFQGLSDIPHFNPDIDTKNPPEKVMDFRHQLAQADGILICSPEYAMGVPGSLKNSIDWTVSSMEFSNKPTALITASSMGEKGHASLLETLKIIEADITDDSQLLISHVKTKIKERKIIDEVTLEKVKRVILSLAKGISARQLNPDGDFASD